MPGDEEYPHEFTETTGPSPPLTGCIHGPPDEPPLRSHCDSHQFAVPVAPRPSLQYMKFGSSLYE
jgi:hypothetical protein